MNLELCGYACVEVGADVFAIGKLAVFMTFDGLYWREMNNY